MNRQDVGIAVKEPVSGVDHPGVSIIEISPNAPASWAAPAIADATDLVPNCQWESQFSAIVDSICPSYDRPLESFLSRTWD